MSRYKQIDPAFKVKWTTALRSGKYRQAQARLAVLKSKRYSYCCLGVACHIEPEVAREVDEWGVNFVYDGRSEDAVLPAPLAKKIGLSKLAENKLIEMNDASTPFSEIADWIDANL